MPDSHLSLNSSKTGASYGLTLNQSHKLADLLDRLAADPVACDRAGLSLDGTRALAAFLRREA